MRNDCTRSECAKVTNSRLPFTTICSGPLALSPERMLESWRSRDALLGRPVRWSGREGTAAGIDGEGRLVVELAGGGRTALDAGEVHLQR